MQKINGLGSKILPCLDGGLFHARRFVVRALGAAVGIVAAMFGGTRDVQAAPPSYTNTYFMTDHMANYGSGLASMYPGLGVGCSGIGGTGATDRAVYNDQNSFRPSTSCIAKLKEIGLCAERSGNVYVMDPCGVAWASGYGKPLSCANGGGESTQLPTLSAGCTLTVDGSMAGMGGGEYYFTMEEDGCGSGWYAFVSDGGCGYSSALCYVDYIYNSAYCDFYTSNYSCSDATNGYMGGGGYRVYYGSGITFACAGAACTQEFEDYFNCYYYRGLDKPSYCTNGTNYMTGTCQNGLLRVEGTGAMLIEEFCEGAGLSWYSGCRVTYCNGYSGYYGVEGTIYMLNSNASGACAKCSELSPSMPPSSFKTSTSTFSGAMVTSGTYSYYAENSNCTGAACCRSSISPSPFTVTRGSDNATLSLQTSGYCYYQP